MSDAVNRDAVMQLLQEWTYCCDVEDVVRALPAVQPGLETALRATLLDLITEQSEGEWDDKTIAKDVEVFLPRILALIDKPKGD